jgi:hypothetical protein
MTTTENQEISTEGVVPTIRYRTNVSRSVKGVYTFDCTVEGTGIEMSELLEKLDELINSMRFRYPDPEEGA